MEHTKINRESFDEAITLYEREQFVSEKVCVLEDKMHLYKFRGTRRSRLAVSVMHAMPFTYLKDNIDNIVKALDADSSLSDTVDVFCHTTVGPSNRENMQALADSRDITLRIIDISDMKSLSSVAKILQSETKTEKGIEAYEKMMFDYLSKANSSSFIKNGFYYSVILFLIYKNMEMTKKELKEAMDRNLGISNDSLDNSLNYLLRTPSRIVSFKKGDVKLYKLSPDEYKKIEESDKESKDLETDFVKRFKQIADKYGIVSVDDVYQKFLDFYVKSGSRIFNMDVDANDSKTCYESFKVSCIKQIGDTEKFNCFLKELNDICCNNSFLNRISLAKSFFGLYNSQKYQNYVSQRQNYIVLDTTLLVHYLCCKLDLSKYDNAEYQDRDFLTVKSLIEYKEQNSSKVKFLVPFDYVSEVVGELRKAFKLSLFDEMKDLAISFQTSNIFFNYYLFVKTLRIENNDNSKYSFSDFVEELGFDVRDCYEPIFFKRNIARMKLFFESTGCEFIDKISDRYDDFDTLERNYASFLFEERYYGKTPKAIEADLRQAIYFAKLSNQNEDKDYYLSSWDTSLYYLRSIVNKDLYYVKSYSIHRPAALLNRLMLKSFKLNDKCFTNEIFAYADRTYEITDKIKSMFDNVITPYFSVAGNNNSTLVKNVIKIQKEYIDDSKEGARSSREKVLPIEDIFVKIIDKLKEHACTTKDLSMYLADKDNTDFVLDLISKAIKSYKDGKRMDISSELCNSLIQYLSQKDKEYMMGETLKKEQDDAGIV